MANKEMTNREFYEAVIKANVSAELTAFAEKGIAKLDARNEKRSSTLSKEQIANEAIKAQIVEFLNTQTELLTSSAIAEAIGITANKASSLASRCDKIEVVEKALKSATNKSKVNGYRIKVAEEVAE